MKSNSVKMSGAAQLNHSRLRKNPGNSRASAAERVNPKKLAGILWAFCRTVLLIEVSFILVYPVLYMFSLAFRPAAQVLDPNIIWIPKSLTLENLKTVWKFIEYPLSLRNTVSIGMVSSLLQVAACCLVGYGFARFKFKERNFLFALVVFTIVVPPQTIAISSYMNFKSFDPLGLLSLAGAILGNPIKINLLDSRWAFYLPAATGMGIRAGLFIFIFRQFFRGMPKDLEDAAYMDGCGPLKVFLKVMVPNAGPAVLTSFLFSAVWYWNDYFHSSMYLDQTRTVSTALSFLLNNIRLINANVGDPYAIVTQLQAGSLLSIIPLLIIYIILQRYFTESIERTGIVG